LERERGKLRREWRGCGVCAAVYVDDPRAAKRDEWAKRWALNAEARESDRHSRRMIDGRPLGEWLVSTNVFPDLTLENHGFWDLPYQTSFAALAEPIMAYRICGRKIPEAFHANALEEGEQILKWLVMPDGDLLCPQGIDWAERDVQLSWAFAELGTLLDQPLVAGSTPRQAKIEGNTLRIGHWSIRRVEDGGLSAEKAADAPPQPPREARKRRIIFDNDGNEPHFLQALTAEDVLRQRTAALAGTQVDTLFYCTTDSFGITKRPSKVWQLFDSKAGTYQRNKTVELAAAGVDVLRVMVEFGHKNGLEVFANIRMNDVHDGSRAPDGVTRFKDNEFKTAHPECLVGKTDRRPRTGSWAAVNYALPRVREHLFRYLDEPRGRDKSALALRSSLLAYRGRAAAAWGAGMDGILLFNFFDPTSRELAPVGGEVVVGA